MELLHTISSWASQYTTLINLLLTIFLVCLTGWYAVVSRRMWREMVDSRLARIRPIPHLTIGRPELEDENERTIKSSVNLRNFGSGPIYALRVKVSLRYEKPDEKTWIGTELKTPPGLAPGQECNVPFDIRSFPTPMDESRKEFLVVMATYQDIEANYYSLKQVYDLRSFDLGKIISRTWQLRSEELRFRRFPRWHRGLHYDPQLEHEYGNMDLLMEYRLPRTEDWSR